MVKYTPEPVDKELFTGRYDRVYTRWASLYDFAVKRTPFWKRWLSQAIPHVRGSRVLEISFGTGYLLAQIADRYEIYGIDLNARLIQLAQANLNSMGTKASLQRGDVYHLPYATGIFDTVINTMSFSGYPAGKQAMREIHRVLKPGGRLVLIDVNYPRDRNLFGNTLTRAWAYLGDIIRDMDALFEQFNLSYRDQEIGGFGSVHLYVAVKESGENQDDISSDGFHQGRDVSHGDKQSANQTSSHGSRSNQGLA